MSIDQEFIHAAKLTDLLYKRLHYKRLVYLVCREAATFYYSRLKVSDNQIFAKSQMIYLIREARHMGIALGLDSVRFYAIDIDIRNLADYDSESSGRSRSRQRFELALQLLQPIHHTQHEITILLHNYTQRSPRLG